MTADWIDRRRFLRRTLLGGALLTLGGTIARHATGYTLDPAIAARLRVLSHKEYLILAAICRRMLAPDEGGAVSPDEIEAALVIDGYLAGLPDAISSDVRALLHLVEHTPLLFDLRFSRFTHLDGAAQDAVLDGWATSRIDLRRRGFQALKALAMLGYYDDPRTFAILDYTGPMLPPATP
ncbi:MAG: hypothetical protein EXR72_25935 [Myxococcales bacterium]|nr:hypothetical protein [Myxococcales bacterium]